MLHTCLPIFSPLPPRFSIHPSALLHHSRVTIYHLSYTIHPSSLIPYSPPIHYQHHQRSAINTPPLASVSVSSERGGGVVKMRLPLRSRGRVFISPPPQGWRGNDIFILESRLRGRVCGGTGCQCGNSVNHTSEALLHYHCIVSVIVLGPTMYIFIFVSFIICPCLGSGVRSVLRS